MDKISIPPLPTPGAKTNLYNDRAKSEHVRFLHDITNSHEELRRSPSRCVPLWLGYIDGIYSATN